MCKSPIPDMIFESSSANQKLNGIYYTSLFFLSIRAGVELEFERYLRLGIQLLILPSNF